MLLAALLLLPFLNTPFTIDDPIYLREAQHALIEPLHPQAFTMVWSTDLELPVSQMLPGGVAAPYLLIPTALAGCTEWAGHLTQLLLFLATLFAASLIALRLGLDSGQARITALLTVACPAALGMAATVMPDIAAMLFVTLGMERILAWRDHRKLHQALLATVWLALATLTRIHTILVLAPAFLFLLDGITAEEIRASFRSFPVRFLPLALVPIAFFIVSKVTADPDFQGDNVLLVMLDLSAHGRIAMYGWHVMLQNTAAFLAHLLLAIPLTIPWLALRWRQLPSTVVWTAFLGAAVLSLWLGWVAFIAAATVVALVDIFRDAILRRDRDQLALWVWLFLAIPVIIYVQLPSKYLLPSVPAAVLLVVREARRGTVRWLIPSVAVAGIVLGLLILIDARDFAGAQRRAVDELILPHLKLHDRVWFSGHWGFQWYAELAGATPVTLDPPLPRPGDIIVVSQADFSRFPQTWTGARTVLRHLSYPGNRLGRVMNVPSHAGFYSNVFGYLPWSWGSGDVASFEVWRVER